MIRPGNVTLARPGCCRTGTEQWKLSGEKYSYLFICGGIWGLFDVTMSVFHAD